MRKVLLCGLVLCAVALALLVATSDAASPAVTKLPTVKAAVKPTLKPRAATKVAKKNNPCRAARRYRRKFAARHTRTKFHILQARKAAQAFRKVAHKKKHRKTYRSSLKHHFATAKKAWKRGRRYATKFRRALGSCIARIQNVRQSFLNKSKKLLQRKPCLSWTKKCRTRRVAVNTKSKKYKSCVRTCALASRNTKQNSTCIRRKCGKSKRVKKCVRVPSVRLATVCLKRGGSRRRKSKTKKGKKVTPRVVKPRVASVRPAVPVAVSAKPKFF